MIDKDDLLLKDFELKLSYLSDQYSRLWQRLGSFLTIETALFGSLAWLAFDRERPDAIPLPGILGILVFAIWYITAAQDRALVVRYRSRLNAVANQIGNRAQLPNYLAKAKNKGEIICQNKN